MMTVANLREAQFLHLQAVCFSPQVYLMWGHIQGLELGYFFNCLNRDCGCDTELNVVCDEPLV